MLILSNKSLFHRQCPFITHSWMLFFWCATCCITRAVPNYNKLFPLKNSKGKRVFVAWLSYNQPVCFEHPSLILSPRRFQLIPQTITMIATSSMPPCKTIRTLRCNGSHNWGLYLWKCPSNRLNCLDDRSIFPWNWQFYPKYQAPVHYVSRILGQWSGISNKYLFGPI